MIFSMGYIHVYQIKHIWKNRFFAGPAEPVFFFARSGTETQKPKTETKSKAIENELGSDSGDHYSSDVATISAELPGTAAV